MRTVWLALIALIISGSWMVYFQHGWEGVAITCTLGAWAILFITVAEENEKRASLKKNKSSTENE